MRLSNRTVQILVAATFALPTSVFAESWSCSRDNNVREVHIERTTAEAVPCNVVYKKQTEGFEDQIPWNATNDDSYCDEKAEGLVAKLEASGWVCAETISDDVGTNSEMDSDAAATSTETINKEIGITTETIREGVENIKDKAGAVSMPE